MKRKFHRKNCKFAKHDKNRATHYSLVVLSFAQVYSVCAKNPFSRVQTSVHSSNVATTNVIATTIHSFGPSKIPQTGTRQWWRTVFWRNTKGFAIHIWMVNWSTWWYFSRGNVSNNVSVPCWQLLHRVRSRRLYEHRGSLRVFVAFAVVHDNKFGAFDVRQSRVRAVHARLDPASFWVRHGDHSSGETRKTKFCWNATKHLLHIIRGTYQFRCFVLVSLWFANSV